MGEGISEILTFAVGVAISPVPIIAVTLMCSPPRPAPGSPNSGSRPVTRLAR